MVPFDPCEPDKNSRNLAKPSAFYYILTNELFFLKIILTCLLSPVMLDSSTEREWLEIKMPSAGT